MSNCTVRIDHYPVAGPLVSLALATEQSNGQVSKLILDLTARAALTPTAREYFEANDLLPEVLSRAGLCESAEYVAISQVSASQSGGLYLYRLQLTFPVTAS